ncbi:hypothetical protein CPB84DRAFT_1756485 [Gymnopilus junonius]|uniref:CxC2-like cysteine cluster KDZ transposase-associated domain-containing protein n=1 Tax=Gymnopilus junonius TaxID=109634 RepID=A0A9P5TF94_GYMJU|nr:hypothetical protein CPB84DRAFT_1756485 [Gymnopilus junonius]
MTTCTSGYLVDQSTSKLSCKWQLQLLWMQSVSLAKAPQVNGAVKTVWALNCYVAYVAGTGMLCSFTIIALWETGVKLYLGHNGLPCPESTSNAGLPLNDDVGGGTQPLEGYNLGPNPPTTFEDSFYATAFEEVGLDAEDEGNEEEDSLEDLKNSQTNLVLQPSSRDQSGNPFIAIINVSGVHHLPVVHCTCQRAEDDILFLEMGLFPASFDRIRTAFTFNVLTDFQLSNLELTDQESILKSHVGAKELQHLGKLALFCAACPQPGINLPDNWKEDTNHILYHRSFIADGNFKADHLVPRNAEDDVHLTDGEAFMTWQADYSEHLKEAISLAPRYAQKPTCHQHRAIADSEKSGPGKHVRGAVLMPALAMQMNMDYSNSQAMKTTHMEEIDELLNIYDVNCLFHVHGHKEECLYRFATTYIPGEYPWCNNGHRTEILDDHMGDSNWKKIINMAATICKKFGHAVTEQKASLEYYDGNPRCEAKRHEDVTHMDVMQSKVVKRRQPTTSQKLDLVNHRRHLQKTIEAFTNTAMEFIEEDLVNSIYNQDSVITDDLDPQDGDKGEPGALSISKADPNGQVLPFPSQILDKFLSLLAMEHRASIIALREKELDICKGHAEDCLETVQGAMIQLSWQFKNKVWPAEGIAQKTRAWEGANILEKVCTLQRRLYIGIAKYYTLSAPGWS